MIRWLTQKRFGPIGLDIGARSVKLVQFSAEHSQLLEATRWELTHEQASAGPKERPAHLAAAIRQAYEGRNFRGREVVVCLSDRELFLQNIRVPKVEGRELERLVHQEAAGRIPFSVAEAEIRYLEAADVRQGDNVMREVIVVACHRPLLDAALEIVERAGLQPVAVDIEPAALLRSCAKQFRRDEDRLQRSLLVHVGHAKTVVVISQGDDALFIKYIDVGGKQMEEAVAYKLEMELADATALRRHNGDRRSDQQDPEISRSIAEAIRPVVDRLVNELSMCVRYHSVTFRGQPLARLVLGGGEATPALLDTIAKRLDLKCELGDPFRAYTCSLPASRRGQWDVAAGLALRNMEPKP